jgi:signal transduction histidine kinase
MANEIALVIERSQAEEEKDRLEEQLRHADRLATIGQLAAGVAHELNEPLGNILGFAQLAAKASGIPEAVGKDLERIISASLHARTVIERLNLFARQSPQRRGLVDLNRVINEGLYFLGHRCAKVGITLVRELASDIPEIIADQSQLYQVLVNLVVNAIQAMPEGGRLTIRTLKYDSQVAFSVEDTGIGIDDETRSKIFLPFFTTKDVNEGTGLGLAVVHGIVMAHGGSITVDSQVGKGSRFEVRLPLSPWPE